MHVKRYTEIAFGWAKKYIDEQISKLNLEPREERVGYPKGGNYTIKSYGYPTITKASRHNQGYSNLEGCTLTESNKMVMAWVSSDNKITLLEDRNAKTGALLRSATLELGHCNCISYNPNTKEIYVAMYTYGTKSSTDDTDDSDSMDTYGFRTDIKIIDYNTFTIKNGTGFDITNYSNLSSFGVSGCCYDAINDTLVITTTTADRSTRELIVLNASTKTLISRNILFSGTDWDKPAGTFQGVQMAHNGYAYMIDSTYKAIYVLEYTAMKPMTIISIDDYDDLGRPVMEIQAISAANKTDPESDLYVFHGGVLAKGSWFLNGAASVINPFKGVPALHRPTYIGDSLNGYVNPKGTNTIQQGNEAHPYIDPNMMFAVLSHKPTRRVWTLLDFLPGKYGIIRADGVDIRIKCENSGADKVEIDEMNIFNSVIHIASPTIRHANLITTQAWFNSATVTESIDAYSSDIKVYRGSGAYKGNNNSYISKYSSTTATDSGFIASN